MKNTEKTYYIKGKNNKSKGITLLALAITITVLIILAGISIYSGKEIIRNAQLQELKTNMLLIQAKSKEYVEKANFKMGINADTKTEEQKQQIRKEVYGTGSEEGAQLEQATNIPTELKISNAETCYWLTQEAQKNWGLDKIKIDNDKDEKYLIEFDEDNEKVEVYNTLGFNGNYSLTQINELDK